MAKKFSQFPSASSIGLGDSVVGLKDGENSRFSFSTVFSYIQSLFVPTSRKINNKALTADITLDASDVGAVDTADVGEADGVASLDSTGKVPSAQLPTIPAIYEDTQAGWDAQITLISENGALYVYTDHGSAEVDGVTVPVPGFKVGDGTSYLIDMAFVAEDIQQQLTSHAADTDIHTNPTEKQFWNDKISCYMSTQNPECLVFDNQS